MNQPTPFDPTAGARPLPYRPPMPERPVAPDRGFQWAPIAVALFIVSLVAAGGLWASDPQRWSTGSGLVAIPLLTIATVPMFLRAFRTQAKFDIAGLMGVGLSLRFLAVFYRYDHRADAGAYHQFGSELATFFRHLQFDVDPGAPLPGTGGQRYLTGLVEVLTNSNQFATFLVFTWLGFVGCYLFYQAFVTALPDGDHRRYALLIFLWPTLVYWPSSIGKDCWIVFSLGMASVGVARVLVRRRGGYSLFAIGVLLASLVRPHIGMLAVVGFGVAFLVGRRAGTSNGSLTPAAVAKVAGLVLLLAVGAVMANRVGDFLDANDLESVDAAITQNVDRTAEGGSAFSAANPQNPVGYVQAAVTILFRPFPFEASGMEQLLTSLEGLVLAGLMVFSWRRLASIPFRLRGEPYVGYALAVVLMLIFVLGTIGNFGILARQRSQIMPFMFVLLSVTVAKKPAVRARMMRPRSRHR